MRLLRNRSFKLLFSLGCLVASIWLAFSLLDLQGRKGIVKDRERELDAATAQNSDLKQKLAQAQTPEFIEQQAREKLGLVKPGEVVVMMTNPTNPPAGGPTNEKSDALPKWKQWWKLFF